jgi:hypothetical protein
MATHNVKVNLPWRELGKSDVQFEIFQGKKKLGRIKISKGGIDWYPKNKKYPKKMGWAKFDRIMNDAG